MHNLRVPGVHQSVPRIVERLRAHRESEGSRQVATVAGECCYKVAGYVVVDAPHVAFQF